MKIAMRIWADYGHFSHPSTIYSSLTYPVPPKTTAIGMLGAIAGLDEYTPLNLAKYSVVIEKIEGKRRFSFNGIGNVLEKLHVKKTSKKDGGGMRVIKGFTNRKQFYRELLVNPSYRLYFDLSEVKKEIREKIVESLEKRISFYPLYMGINFCIAEYEYLGKIDGEEKKKSALIDSIVPLEYDFEIEPGKRYGDFRAACHVNEHREFGDFRDFLVELEGRGVRCEDAEHFLTKDGKRIVWI